MFLFSISLENSETMQRETIFKHPKRYKVSYLIIHLNLDLVISFFCTSSRNRVFLDNLKIISKAIHKLYLYAKSYACIGYIVAKILKYLKKYLHFPLILNF